MAAAHLELHNYAAAAEEARKAIDCDASWHKPYLRLCMALAGLGRSPDVIAEVLRSGLQVCKEAPQLCELQGALSALVTPSSRDEVAAQDNTASSDDSAQALRSEITPKRQRLGPPGVQLKLQLTLPLAQKHPPLAAVSAVGTAADASDPEQSCHGHQQPLRVTALCGFLGAGKTTLVRHLLSCMGAGAAARVGLLVNDLAPLNVDAQLLAMPPPQQQPHATAAGQLASPLPQSQSQSPPCSTSAPEPARALATGVCPPRGAAAAAATLPAAAPAPPPRPAELGEVVELSNGCVCCNLSGELQATLRRMAARNPPLEHIVVECTGVGEPAALAAAVEALAAEASLPATWPAGGCKGDSRGGTDGGSGGAGSVPGDGVDQARQLLGPAEGNGSTRRLVLHSMVTVVDASSFLRAMQPHRGASDGASSPCFPGAEQEVAGNGDGVMGGGGCGGRETTGAAGGCATGASGVAATRGHPAEERKPLASLLAQQVEGADVVLLNKCDRLLDAAEQKRQQRQAAGEGVRQAAAAAEVAARRELARVAALVRCLNPAARVLPCVRCEVPLEAILGGPGSGEARLRLAAAPGPAAAAAAARDAEPCGGSSGPEGLGDGSVASGGRGPGGPPTKVPRADAEAEAGDGGGKAHEEDEYGVGSYVFRSRRPFHPARLWVLLQALAGEAHGPALAGGAAPAHAGGGLLPVLPFPPPPLLRAKGMFWIASLPQAIWELSLAGAEVEVAAVGRWLCTMVDPEHWPVGNRPAGRQTETASPVAQSQQADDSEGRRQQQQQQQHYHHQQRRQQQEGGSGASGPEELVAGSPGGLGPAGCRADAGEEGEVLGAGQKRSCKAESAGAPHGSEEMGGSACRSHKWHHRWGDRENGLVFIGLDIAQVANAAEGEEEEGQAGARSMALSQRGTSAAIAGAKPREQLAWEMEEVGQVPPSERLAALLHWAQVTAEEESAGEEGWEAWDDGAWLALLERY